MPDKKFLFKEGRRPAKGKPRSAPIPEEVWEFQKRRILQAYLDQNQPRWSVARYMREQFNFIAT